MKGYVDLIFRKEVKTKLFSTQFVRGILSLGSKIKSASTSVIKDFALHGYSKNAEHFHSFSYSWMRG